MTTPPIHYGMPCDPLTVDDEPWVPEPVTRCPECPTSMGGRGRIEHIGPDYHAWTPDTEPPSRSRLVLVLLAVALAVIGLRRFRHA